MIVVSCLWVLAGLVYVCVIMLCGVCVITLLLAIATIFVYMNPDYDPSNVSMRSGDIITLKKPSNTFQYLYPWILFMTRRFQMRDMFCFKPSRVKCGSLSLMCCFALVFFKNKKTIPNFRHWSQRFVTIKHPF